jgi:hypothetical protein
MLYNWIEEVGMSKGTRITVDLGSEELLKAVKFASVEQNKPIREIIIEALEQWLGGKKDSRQQEYLAIWKLWMHTAAPLGRGAD